MARAAGRRQAAPVPVSWYRSRHGRDVIRRALAFIVLSLGAILFVAPFAWMVSTALKTQLAMYYPNWIPNPAVWSNFRDALTSAEIHLIVQRFEGDPQRVAEELVDAANAATGRDNDGRVAATRPHEIMNATMSRHADRAAPASRVVASTTPAIAHNTDEISNARRASRAGESTSTVRTGVRSGACRWSALAICASGSNASISSGNGT